jgi:prolyl-tRNA synthetase
MGGSQSHEFMVPSEAGEDFVAVCRKCGYRANLEKAVATAAAPQGVDPEGALEPEEFHTPGRKTIAEVAEFTGLPESSQMKSLVLVADGKPVLVLVRGDHQLSETKFGAVVGDPEFRPAHPGEIVGWFGAEAGSLGPVGVTNMPILADHALQGRKNMIAGANKNDYHLRNVTPGEDFQAEFHDLRQVVAGDQCCNCGSPVDVVKTIEIGHIFKLGYRYSETMGLRVLNADGKEVTPIMGSYGIGIERILSAAIELYHDNDGMMLPPSIAPFTVVVTPVNIADASQREAAEEIYRQCLTLGLDALLDDRDERPGVKFKDADLIGVPFRITVGKKLASGQVELVERRGKKSSDVPVAEAASTVAGRVQAHPNGR